MLIRNKRAYMKCPFHTGRHKTPMVITLEGTHTGKYYCFSCGRAGQLNKEQLEKFMAKKKKNPKQPPVNIDWLTLALQYNHNWAKNPIKEPFPVAHKYLGYLCCGWDGEAWTFPMRDYKNNIIGIQRRFPDGFKCCVEGSKNGLFIPQIEVREPVYITEGVSDLCSLLNIGKYGIGRMNCQMIDEVLKWVRYNKVKNCVVIADNDEPGLKGGRNLSEKLDCELLVPSKGNDLREHLENGGTL